MDKTQLTWEDVEDEVSKVRQFFLDLPEDLRSDVACRLIGEIVLWGACNHFEALGIFEEAKLFYRNLSLAVMNDGEEDT
ncbi:MAG TPA: hypothetical protein VMY35_17300 [Phycisphaerae bacterium]|nr:hypothetical protein [Phycisphaerae bacterium]